VEASFVEGKLENLPSVPLSDPAAQSQQSSTKIKSKIKEKAAPSLA
jgi:hypothetical protein